MTTLADARQFLVELISQLSHADVLITQQAERVDVLEAGVARLRAASGDTAGGRVSGHPRQRKSSDPVTSGGDSTGVGARAARCRRQ